MVDFITDINSRLIVIFSTCEQQGNNLDLACTIPTVQILTILSEREL